MLYNYIKQTFSLFLIIVLSNSTFGMEKNPVSSFNSERVRAHFELLKASTNAIEGSEQEELKLEEVDQEFLDQPTRTFLSDMKKRFKDYELSLLAEKGILQEMIDAQKENARELNTALSVIEEGYSPVSSPIKKEVQEVARSMGVSTPEVKKAKTGDVAYVRGNHLVLDLEHLEKIAGTPRRRKVLYRHELEHAKCDHSVEVTAQKLAAQLADPEKNPLSPAIQNKVSRIREVVCDQAACASPTSAHAMMSIFENSDTPKRKARELTGHPSDSDRHKIAAASVSIHRLKNPNIRRDIFKDLDKPGLD